MLVLKKLEIMLKIPITNYCIKNPEELRSLQLHNHDTIKKMIEKKEIIFTVPSTAVNKEKQYKIGFLRDCLTILYPELEVRDIYAMLKSNFDVFLSKRSMERNYKVYLKCKDTFF